MPCDAIGRHGATVFVYPRSTSGGNQYPITPFTLALIPLLKQGAIWRVSGFLRYLDLWFGFIWRIEHMLCPSAGSPFQNFFFFFTINKPYNAVLCCLNYNTILLASSRRIPPMDTEVITPLNPTQPPLHSTPPIPTAPDPTTASTNSNLFRLVFLLWAICVL